MIAELPARLAEVARHVLPGLSCADVGTDHAALPAWLVARGLVPSAIGIDVADGPLRGAALRLGGGVELRRGDGLSPLSPGEVGTVVIAGMGGARIRRIVDAWPHLATLRRLVVQPNTEWRATRRWIAARGFSLVDEAIVGDRGHDYLVLALAPDRPTSHAWTEADLALGPILRRRRPAAWQAWVERERARLTAAREAAACGGDERARAGIDARLAAMHVSPSAP